MALMFVCFFTGLSEKVFAFHTSIQNLYLLHLQLETLHDFKLVKKTTLDTLAKN